MTSVQNEEEVKDVSGCEADVGSASESGSSSRPAQDLSKYVPVAYAKFKVNDKLCISEQGKAQVVMLSTPGSTDEDLEAAAQRELKLFTDNKLPKHLRKKRGITKEPKFNDKVKFKKTHKYEFLLVFKKPKGELAVRRIVCGQVGQPDAKTTDKETTQEMRSLYKKLSIFTASFDQDLFIKCGGIFNRKFWDINISWGNGSDNETCLSNTVEMLANHLTGL